jgi:hypothetical protein
LRARYFSGYHVQHSQRLDLLLEGLIGQLQFCGQLLVIPAEELLERHLLRLDVRNLLFIHRDLVLQPRLLPLQVLPGLQRIDRRLRFPDLQF